MSDCPFEITTDIPAGNIVVERIDGDTVYVRQDQRDTLEEWWFYWHFAVRHAAGRMLRFVFTKENVLGTRGPAVSTDGGWTWQWLGASAAAEQTFSYTFAADADDVRFSFAMPYTQRNLTRFLQHIRQGNPNAGSLQVQTLCQSPKGRDVPLLRVGNLSDDPPHRVVITGRHHCCEMMPNYVIEGIIETALASAAPGAWLRENAAIYIVPFVDCDGVEAGDQGKCRHPHDHNRDYGPKFIYPETKALRELVTDRLGTVDLVTDLHCPHIRGKWNEHIYSVGKDDAANTHRSKQLSELLEASITGPLPYAAADDLAFGVAWNVARNYHQGKGFAQWACEQPGVWCSAGYEIPYANVGQAEVNAASARAFGLDFGVAVQRFLSASRQTA